MLSARPCHRLNVRYWHLADIALNAFSVRSAANPDVKGNILFDLARE
jgi:hypothetical protein